MSMLRWDPFREFVTLRDAMDRLFEENVGRSGRLTGSPREVVRALPIDLYETPNEVVLKAALPGARPEDVDINVTGDVLTIKGKIHSDAEKEEAAKWNWLYHELWHGEFARSLQLPVVVQADKAEARFEEGVLTLVLPKADEVKPRQIKVQAREAITGR